jgi:hypothetical protein
VARDLDRQQHVGLQVTAGLGHFEIRERRVVRAGAGDEHVVDRRRQRVEEGPEPLEVGRVEGGAAPRAELARDLLQPVGVAGGEDDLGALGAGQPGRREPDPGAAADDDDGLPLHCAPAPTSRSAAIARRNALSGSR